MLVVLNLAVGSLHLSLELAVVEHGLSPPNQG